MFGNVLVTIPHALTLHLRCLLHPNISKEKSVRWLVNNLSALQQCEQTSAIAFPLNRFECAILYLALILLVWCILCITLLL